MIVTDHAAPDEEPPAPAVTTRLGFPRQRAAVRYGLAGLANNLGTGMFYPFAILFFHHQLHASLVTVGACYTVAIGLGVVGVTRTGALADRFGARTVLVGDALIRAAIFLAYPALHDIAVVFVLAAVASLADRTDRVAGQAIVAVLAPEEARPAWFSLNQMVQNAGLGGGAVVGGLILGTSRGYDWLAWGNAISFAFVAVLYATLRIPRAPRAAKAAAAAEGARPGGVWSDRLFLRAAGLGGLVYLVGLAVEIGLPVYLVAVRHEPGWTVSVVIGINTGIVTLFQMPVTERIRRRPAMLMLASGTGAYLVTFVVFLGAGRVSGGLLVTGLALATCLFTLGELATSVTNIVVVNGLAVPERRGAYLGVAQFFVGAAVTTAPLLYTAGLQLSPNWLWTAMAVLAALIIVAVWRLRDPVAARIAELSRAEAAAETTAAV
jgi:MFS family permease